MSHNRAHVFKGDTSASGTVACKYDSCSLRTFYLCFVSSDHESSRRSFSPITGFAPGQSSQPCGVAAGRGRTWSIRCAAVEIGLSSVGRLTNVTDTCKHTIHDTPAYMPYLFIFSLNIVSYISIHMLFFSCVMWKTTGVNLHPARLQVARLPERGAAAIVKSGLRVGYPFIYIYMYIYNMYMYTYMHMQI